MKAYLLSLLAGILVGVIYNLIRVRSPAPPLVALVGLLGILGGEQIIPVSKHLFFGSPLSTAPQESHSAPSLSVMPLRGHMVEQASRENADSKERHS
ncbi:DUF1427 family protein [Paraburkholderia sp. EG286A]|uniref:DUF1427 family protein n=1 Tax=Paraburkholderia sp. EG286A TaxID=3237014 RepID=UPI0034D20D05